MVLLAFMSYKIATLKDTDTLDPRECDCFPDPGSLSFTQGEAVLFPVFCQEVLWKSPTQDNYINKTMGLGEFIPDRSVCLINTTAACKIYNTKGC